MTRKSKYHLLDYSTPGNSTVCGLEVGGTLRVTDSPALTTCAVCLRKDALCPVPGVKPKPVPPLSTKRSTPAVQKPQKVPPQDQVANTEAFKDLQEQLKAAKSRLRNVTLRAERAEYALHAKHRELVLERKESLRLRLKSDWHKATYDLIQTHRFDSMGQVYGAAATVVRCRPEDMHAGLLDNDQLVLLCDWARALLTSQMTRRQETG